MTWPRLAIASTDGWVRIESSELEPGQFWVAPIAPPGNAGLIARVTFDGSLVALETPEVSPWRVRFTGGDHDVLEAPADSNHRRRVLALAAAALAVAIGMRRRRVVQVPA